MTLRRFAGTTTMLVVVTPLLLLALPALYCDAYDVLLTRSRFIDEWLALVDRHDEWARRR